MAGDAAKTLLIFECACTVGFEDAGFDRGVLDFRSPDDSSLMRQTPLPGGAACCSTIGVLAAGVSVIGWPYLIAKTHLIRKVGCLCVAGIAVAGVAAYVVHHAGRTGPGGVEQWPV